MEHHDLRTIETDLLIIGGGGAAAMAALRATKCGMDVSIASKESAFVGGATIQATGGVSIRWDRNDNPGVFYRDIMAGGGFLNNPRLVRILANHATQGLLKLEEYRYHLDRNKDGQFHMIKRSEGHMQARGYLDRRESIGLCHALEKALLGKNIRFYPETIISKILITNGRATGAIGFDLVTGDLIVFVAKAVLIATGGLGQLFKLTTNSRTLTGDGIAMAWESGAKLTDMEMVQFIPLAFPYPKSWEGVFIGMCSLWGPNLRLYNSAGERFMGRYDPDRMESTTRDIASRANYTEIAEGRGTPRGGIIVDPTENDRALLPQYQASLYHVYNRARKIFGPEAANWQAPFEATPSQHFFMGGAVVDEEMKTDVPGLFAVGEVTGGMHGANRLSGTALTEIFVFGDLAGRTASEWIKRNDMPEKDEKLIRQEANNLNEAFAPKGKEGIRPFEIKKAIKETMWNLLGPVRDKPGMARAIDKLEDLNKNHINRVHPGSGQERYNKERMELCEVRFMATVALLIARSAYLREESRGSHYVRDFPSTDDKNWLKNIVLRRGTDGEPLVTYNEVRKDI